MSYEYKIGLRQLLTSQTLPQCLLKQCILNEGQDDYWPVITP